MTGAKGKINEEWIQMVFNEDAMNNQDEGDVVLDNYNEKNVARVIAITSGKGGVGKTNIATNIGIALASHRKKVCLLDADMGLANINILIGKEAEHSLEDILSGEKKINDVLMDGPGGIKIVPASSGIEKIVTLGPKEHEYLMSAFDKIEKQFDYLLIDTAAGISPTVISFIQSAQDTVVIVSPEPTSLTDAYALVKVLKRQGFGGTIYILVNMVLSYEDSVKIFNKFNSTTKKYLNAEMKYLGYVLMDKGLIASVIRQEPIMLFKPKAAASLCIASVARKFESTFLVKDTVRFTDYWKGLMPDRKPVEKAEVVALPNEIKDSFDHVHDQSIDEMANTVSKMIERGTVTEDNVNEFLQQIENSFITKFNQQPYDLKTILYRSLEFSKFSEESIKELHLLLESIYHKRFNKSLYDLENVFMKLLEDSSTSKGKMKILLQMLENSYCRQFGTPILAVKDILDRELTSDAFFEDGFFDLIASIKKIYSDRFGIQYEEPGIFPVLEVEEILTIFKRQDSEIGELVGQISNNLNNRQEKLDRLTATIKKFDSDHEGQPNL